MVQPTLLCNRLQTTLSSAFEMLADASTPSPAARVPVTDVHAHVIVGEILRERGGGEAWRPRVHRDGEGRQIVEIDGRSVRSMVRPVTDLDAILAAQDAAGVDRVVLSPVVTLVYYDAEPQAGLERCRIQNDGLERLVGQEPQRVSALGVVPLQDPALAAAELRALMVRGRLSGVEIGASVRDVYLGDERFEPFWAAAAETGAVVFIHPRTRGFDDPIFDEHYLWNLVGNPIETTLTAAHLVLSGVLERHPQLRIVLAHGGGAVLALRGRLRHGHQAVPSAGPLLHGEVYASLRRFYYDTAVHDPAVLRAIIDFAGPEHVLLGSDFPFDMGESQPAQALRSAELRAETEAAILGGNALRLLAG
jgi:aminocarboxymuconate-semialdehyde decarboxylase